MPAAHTTCTLTDLRSFSLRIPSLRLVVTPPERPPVMAPLRLAPVVVGTAPDAGLIVLDDRVSRHHCEVKVGDDGIILRDLASKNGTFVGSIRIREVLLPLDVDVTIGTSRLSVQVAGEPATLPLSRTAGFGGAIGGSAAMRVLFAQLERVAPTHETILLIGESGTGKEVLARAIHDKSPRQAAPYLVVDCSAMAPSLVEDLLFGHVRGAFTGANEARAGVFEQAQGGTLFIDEIGELPLELQPKLLRALESRTVQRLGDRTDRRIEIDCRVIAAGHRDLRALVAEGRFRQDLYYRLQVIELRVPPLRERKDDIPLLVERFLASQAPPRRIVALPPNALEMLAAHDWPGNVRELRNTVARLVLLGDIHPALEPPASGPRAEDNLGPLLDLPLSEAREQLNERFERAYLEAKLRKAGGVVKKAADAMGVSPQMVYKLMGRYGMPRGER